MLNLNRMNSDELDTIKSNTVKLTLDLEILY